MRLTVIVPAYNESATVTQLLEQLTKVAAPDWQIVVVDDSSTDNTREILRELRSKLDFELIERPENGGKTAAVRDGLAVAHGNWVLVQDADLEYVPTDIPRLLQEAERWNSVVYGQRPSYWQRPSRWIFAMGVLGVDLSFLAVYGRFVRDHATCYKLLPRKLLQAFELQSTGFEGCVEITAKLMRSGVAIRQIPISYEPRPASAGKKLTAWYGVQAIRSVLHWRKWKPTSSVKKSAPAPFPSPHFSVGTDPTPACQSSQGKEVPS